MALKIADCEVGGVAVLALEGRMMLGEETVKFREKVKEVVAAGKKNRSELEKCHDDRQLGSRRTAHCSFQRPIERSNAMALQLGTAN